MSDPNAKKKNTPYRATICFTAAAVLLAGGCVGYDALLSRPEEPPAVSLGLTAELKKPEFDKQSGTYAESFTLTLSTATTGGRIFYTTDGTLPTAESQEYLLPITISDRSNEPEVLASRTDVSPNAKYVPEERITKGTVIRAVTMDPAGNLSEVATHTYIVGKDYGDIGVVFLTTDPVNFYDDATGIYVLGDAFKKWKEEADPSAEIWESQGNYSQKGREWERPIHFEITEPDGTVFSQNLGVRIMGAASRTYFQKSFRFFARTDYDEEKRVNYALIPGALDDSGEPLEKYKTFLLRSGGNDTDYAKIRDPFIQSIFADRNFAVQESRPVIAFLNGEYWGIYSLRTDYSDNWVQYYYGVPNEDVVSIKKGEVEDGEDADIELYEDFVNFIEESDFSDDKQYGALCERMDIQGFMDYMCAHILIGNEDGPIQGNNWRIWRSRTVTDLPYQDGKWRFMFYDTEFSLGLYEDGKNYRINHFKKAMTEKTQFAVLFQKCMENESFKEGFIDTFFDMLSNNFSASVTTPTLDALEQQYKPYMSDQFNRFGPDWVAQWMKPYENYYANQVANIRTYLTNRRYVILDQMKETLGVEGDEVSVTISAEDGTAGSIRVNTSEIDWADGKWNGKSLTGRSVKITATPAEGYTFTGWSGDVTSSDQTITVTLDGDLSLTPVFTKN